jgi:hypothetical protein
MLDLKVAFKKKTRFDNTLDGIKAREMVSLDDVLHVQTKVHLG